MRMNVLHAETLIMITTMTMPKMLGRYEVCSNKLRAVRYGSRYWYVIVEVYVKNARMYMYIHTD